MWTDYVAVTFTYTVYVTFMYWCRWTVDRFGLLLRLSGQTKCNLRKSRDAYHLFVLSGSLFHLVFGGELVFILSMLQHPIPHWIIRSISMLFPSIKVPFAVWWIMSSSSLYPFLASGVTGPPRSFSAGGDRNRMRRNMEFRVLRWQSLRTRADACGLNVRKVRISKFPIGFSIAYNHMLRNFL